MCKFVVLFETAGVHRPPDARSAPALLSLICSSLVQASFRKKIVSKYVRFPGTDGSGKSTFLRQMKIIHDGGFTDEELAEIKPDVYR